MHGVYNRDAFSQKAQFGTIESSIQSAESLLLVSVTSSVLHTYWSSYITTRVTSMDWTYFSTK